ncbi:MAG: hypothetical protein M0Q46_06515 [Endomicrobiales bacterium]|nr:hypothetical protein [Endomicrobiales bacterium]
MIKKLLVFQAVFFFIVACSFAANPFDQFNNALSGVPSSVAQKNLDNFAKDFGVLLGGGSYHQAKVLGFPGLDIGIHVPIIKTSDENTIVKASNVDNMFLPILQAEIGLPAKFDLIGRFVSYENSTLIGGGVRYGIIKSALPVVPNVSVQAIYTQFEASVGVNKFKADDIGVNALASFDLPVITPYVGLGYNSINVIPDSSITNLTSKVNIVRIEGGINLALLPATYLQLGANSVDGRIGYVLGLGAKF